jgi:hypothetical protein
MTTYPKVTLTEEGMRDGMQIERADIPVKDKIKLLNALSQTGLKEIAVGSFVNPRWVPQMTCIDELVQGFDPKPGVTYVATALNEKGRERIREYVPPCQKSKTGFRRRYICAMSSPSETLTGRRHNKSSDGRRLLLKRRKKKLARQASV